MGSADTSGSGPLRVRSGVGVIGAGLLVAGVMSGLVAFIVQTERGAESRALARAAGEADARAALSEPDRTAASCLNAALLGSSDCRRDVLSCRAFVQAFAAICITEGHMAESWCRAVPPPRSPSWAQRHCDRLGLSGHPACVVVFAAAQRACSSRERSARADAGKASRQ